MLQRSTIERPHQPGAGTGQPRVEVESHVEGNLLAGRPVRDVRRGTPFERDVQVLDPVAAEDLVAVVARGIGPLSLDRSLSFGGGLRRCVRVLTSETTASRHWTHGWSR